MYKVFHNIIVALKVHPEQESWRTTAQVYKNLVFKMF